MLEAKQRKARGLWEKRCFADEPDPSEYQMSDDTLCCPCHEKRALVSKGDALACLGPDCPHADRPHLFTRHIEAPVLIAFEKTDTVCRPEVYAAGAVYFPRNASKLMDLARRLVYGVSKVSIDNCARFVSLIHARAPEPKVLVIGSGAQGSGTAALWNDPRIKRTGVDIYYSPSVDYIADAHYLPFKDASFDGVWIQAVLEHVASPEAVVAEIERVLKPQGVVYAETPFMQQVHEGAYDFTRYSVTAHRYLFRKFDLLGMGGNGGPGFVLAWSVKYLVWGLTRNKTAGNAAALPFYLLAQIFDRIVAPQSYWDGPSGVYFMGSKSGQCSLRVRDLPSLYEGFQR